MTRHVCLSVRGSLLKSKKVLLNDFRGVITVDGKILKSEWEIRNFFMDELSKGHEVIPLGEPCEGFDYKKGCQGHESTEIEIKWPVIKVSKEDLIKEYPCHELDEDQVELGRLKSS